MSCCNERNSEKKQIELAQKWANTYQKTCYVYKTFVGFQFCEAEIYKGNGKFTIVEPK